MKKLYTLVLLFIAYNGFAQGPNHGGASRSQTDTLFWSATGKALYRLPDINQNGNTAGYIAGTDQENSALYPGYKGNIVTEEGQLFPNAQPLRVTGAIFEFGDKKFVSGNNHSYITFKLYALDSVFVDSHVNIVPGPGTLLSKVDVPLSNITVDSTNFPYGYSVQFPNPPTINTGFAVTFNLDSIDPIDTLGLFTTVLGQVHPTDRSLVKFNNGNNWASYIDASNGWGEDLDLAIFPIIDGDYNSNCLQFYTYVNSTPANCGSNGSATVIPYYGTPPYIYLWNNNDSTATIGNLASGNYSVQVIDALGCEANGYAAIESGCSTVITGRVFTDVNNNCIYDSGDTIAELMTIAVTQNGTTDYTTSDVNGNYSLETKLTGSVQLSAASNYARCTSSNRCSKQLNISALGDTLTNNDIGIETAQGFDFGLHPGWWSANPGFPKEYWIIYYNYGAFYSGTATIIFTYDSNLIYNYSLAPLPIHNASAHTLTWKIDNMPVNVFDWDNRLQNFFTVSSTLDPGYKLQNDFIIYPTEGDCDITDNHLHFSELVTGSHDPNEKEVSPANYVYDDDSVLTYTIHFQNNGTDSTHFVTVVDTLSEGLNPATARTIASSDKYSSFTITGRSILTWVFNPLRLVDSATNPTGSKGFVTFTVERNANRSLGSVISNTASIYFDYNTPVRTNQVTDTVAVRTAISDLNIQNIISVNAFPNPTTGQLIVTTSGFAAKWISVFDIDGRKITTLPAKTSNNTEVNIAALSNGIYFIEATGENQVARKKVVKM